MYNSILNFIHNFKLKATYTRQSQNYAPSSFLHFILPPKSKTHV